MKQLNFFRKTLTAPVCVWNNCSSHLSHPIRLLVCPLLLTGRMNKCGWITLRERCSFSLSSSESGLYWNSWRICSFLGHFRMGAGKDARASPMLRPFQAYLLTRGPLIFPWTERSKQKEQTLKCTYWQYVSVERHVIDLDNKASRFLGTIYLS